MAVKNTKNVVQVNNLDNTHGVTQRVLEVNSIDNTHGVTQRVYVVGGGSAPVIDELNVTPSTSAQTITAPSGTDGYSPVNVSAVTSSIDANIVAGNIKKDVSILGVTGSYEGVAPSGTKQITTNGTHDVAGYANADVQVPTTAPAHYIEKSVDANGKLVSGSTLINLSGVTTIDRYGLAYAYYYSTGLSGNIDLSPIKKLIGQSAMDNCFYECSNITGVNISGLEEVTGVQALRYTFSRTGITSITFTSLHTITGTQALQNCFYSCSNLTSISFPALKSTSFGTPINQFSNMLGSVTGCTIHFPSNLDPAGGSTVISSLSGYPNFGGTNTVLAFDLPATES